MLEFDSRHLLSGLGEVFPICQKHYVADDSFYSLAKGCQYDLRPERSQLLLLNCLTMAATKEIVISIRVQAQCTYYTGDTGVVIAHTEPSHAYQEPHEGCAMRRCSSKHDESLAPMYSKLHGSGPEINLSGM